MKFKPGRLFFAGLALYFIFLIIQAPAYLLNYFLSRATQNQFVLDQPVGTIWRGSATHLIIQPNGASVPLSVIRWETSFFALFRGELVLNLAIEDARYPVHGMVALANQRVHIKNLQAQLPPAALIAFAPQFHIWQPRGQFTIKAENFLFTSGAIKGGAEIQWIDATLNLVPGQSIGTYRATITGTPQGADIALNTLAGPLNIQGAGRWSQDQGLKFSGVAQARSHGEQLVPLLKIIGQEESNGLYKIAIR